MVSLLDGTDWLEVLKPELKQPYMRKLASFLQQEKALDKVLFPPEDLIFNAFRQTPFKEVKVVIVGQDPYHGVGQAHGLCFSVQPPTPPPPSLKNIFKELIADVGINPPQHGSLLSWSKQGVLLLNAILTVEAGKPLSHQGLGWEKFTDFVIKCLVKREDPLVFLLWGKSAQEKCIHIFQEEGKSQHCVLQAAHPSPYSAQRFLGCRHFSKANQFLVQHGKKPIDWNVN